MSRKKSSILPPQSSQEFARLKITKGPHKGEIYRLVASKIMIGRSSENDIVLKNDKKCSRKQLIILLGLKGYSLKDMSERASVKVNQTVKLRSELQDGDIIQVGNSTLVFEWKNPAPLLANLSAQPMPSPNLKTLPFSSHVPNKPLMPVSNSKSGELVQKGENTNPLALSKESPSDFPASQGMDWSAQPPPPKKGQRKKKKSLSFKLLLFSIVIGVAYLLSNETKQEKDYDQLRTSKNIEENIKTLSELRQEEEKKRAKNSLINFKNSQYAYVKGVRDYRKGFYGRAIESFRVCKTLYPEHDLCSSYLQKSQIKKQQLIQAWMIAGRDYREKRRFASCMSSFKNVMLSIKNKRNSTYKEANENYNICKLQYEDRY